MSRPGEGLLLQTHSKEPEMPVTSSATTTRELLTQHKVHDSPGIGQQMSQPGEACSDCFQNLKQPMSCGVKSFGFPSTTPSGTVGSLSAYSATHLLTRKHSTEDPR